MWRSARTQGTDSSLRDKSTFAGFCEIKRGAQRWTILAPWLFTELKLEEGERGNLPLISPWMCSQVWVRQRLWCTVCQVLKGEWCKTPRPFYLGQQEGLRQCGHRGQGLKTHLYERGPKLNDSVQQITSWQIQYVAFRKAWLIRTCTI